MKTTLDSERLTIHLEGHIDSRNAQAVESELFETVASHPNTDVSIDASELEYISSAGLRILMKLRKQLGRALPVLDVSPEVYEVFDVTGFTALMDVRKRLREVSVEGCDLIGSGGFGRVYRTDPETIVKIYNPGITLDMVQHERDTAQKAFLAGVPTAISYDVVRCGESYGVVYELINAQTVAQILDADRNRVREMGTKSANLLKQLHTIELESDALPNRKAEFLAWLPKVAPLFEPAEEEAIRTFIEALPDSSTFLHGDFNSKNIMVQEDGEFLLIDIGDAAIGHPVFDVVSLILSYVYLPKSPMPEKDRYGLLGFSLDDAPTMWETMCGTYFGIDDPVAIQDKTQELMPYAQLMASYQGTRRCGYNMDYMSRVSIPGIRQRLLPLIRTAKSLDW